MKFLRASLSLLAAATVAHGAEEIFDRIEDALTFSSRDTRNRARVSGTLELEGYALQLPALGVIRSTRERFVTPRLTTFLDAQFGRGVYAFVQARADRGFDPSEVSLRARLDEYALRITPWGDGRLHLQLGRFATVVGNWAGRHGAWSNSFITAPLPYEYLTGIWDNEVIRTSNVLLQWSHLRPGLPASVTAVEKSLRLPIVWGPSYATGLAVSGDLGRWRYAAEVKAGSLSSRPEVWEHSGEQRDHPTISARLGYRPNAMWHLGFSASSGSYLRESATRTMPAGYGRGDYRQKVLAHDISFAWHHLQVWGEVYAARFEIPRVGDADTLAYYAEVKYKLSPQLFGALRWNQQVFDTIPDRGTRTRWGKNVVRGDVAAGYRLTTHAQFKVQYSLQDGDGGNRRYTGLLGAQLTVRF